MFNNKGIIMWPNSIRTKSLFIVITCLYIFVSQASAALEKTDKGNCIGRWGWGTVYSDLKLTHHDVYRSKLSSGSSLGEFGMAIISGYNKIDAIHQLSNGNFVISTYSTVTLDGTKYDSGDLIEYNAYTGQSNLYFNGDSFSNKENIDAVYIRENGNIVLSTKDDAKLGGISFKSNDVVEYNPITRQASILVNGGVIGSKQNIDALHILDDGDIIFSVSHSGKSKWQKFCDEDLFRFDFQTGTTLVLADFEKISHRHNINGLTMVIPEPATAVLLIAGAFALLRKRKLNGYK